MFVRARRQARLSVKPTGFAYQYSDWFGSLLSRLPTNATMPSLWERAAEVVAAGPPPYRPALILRDLHPGNVLWRRSRWSGVVDWANACAGPAGCDVSHCRGNLLRLGGVEAADRFRAAYESVTDAPYHPYWDLADVYEHGSVFSDSQIGESELRLSRALAELGQHPVTGTPTTGRRPGRPRADWELSSDLVAAIVKDQFPALEADDVRLVGSGWDNDVYLLNNRWCFRFPRRAESIPWLEREMKIMPVVTGAVPEWVPRFRWRGQPTKRFPHPFVGYQWIPGVEVDRAEHPDPGLLAADLAAALGQIHRIAITGIPTTPAGWEDKPWTINLDKLSAISKLLESVLSPALLEAAQPYLLGEAPPPPRRGLRRFIHNDLRADHVLVDPTGRLSGIIDFGDAMVGDPVVDFVGLITVGDREFIGEVVRTYPLPVGKNFGTTFDWLARVFALRRLADALIDHPDHIDQQLTWTKRAFDNRPIAT